MYMTNEGWEQNNQDYLKESYEKTGFTAGGYRMPCVQKKRVFLSGYRRSVTRNWRSAY